MYSSRPIKPCFFCFKVDLFCDEGDIERKTSAARLFFLIIEQMFPQKGNPSNYADFHNLVDLCGPCFKIVDQFCSIYHQLRYLELQLNWKLETLSHLIGSADRVPSRLNSFREGQGSGLGIEDIEEGYGGIKGPQVFENLMKVRHGLMKQRSSHLSNRALKLILSKCDLEVEKGPEQVPEGVIAIKISQNPLPISSQVRKETQCGENDGQAPVFFVGWLFSILSVVLLSQEDILRTNTFPNSIPAAQMEIGQESLVETKNSNTSTGDEHEGVGAEGKENVGVGGLEIRTESWSEMDDEFAGEISATNSQESDLSSPSEVNKTLDSSVIDPISDAVNKISIERLKSDLEEVVHDANLKRQVEHFGNGGEGGGEANERMPHSCRALRTIHKCPKCQSTFSNSARLKLHQNSCEKDPAFEVNDNSDGECVKVESCIPSEVQQEASKEQDWNHFYESDPSESSSDEMDCTEEPASVYKPKEESPRSGSASSKTILAECTIWPPPPLYIDRKKLAKFNKSRKKLHSSPLSEDLQFKCSDCPKTFPRRRMLQEHTVFNHGPGFDAPITPGGMTFREFTYKDKAQFHCQREKCSKKFHTQDDLDTHSKLHGNFPCSLCEQVETFAQDLALHEASHVEKSTSSKDHPSSFKCARCPFKAQMKSVFVNHVLETHLGITNDNIKCPICQASFMAAERKESLLSSLYQHFVSQHYLTESASKDEVYKCDKCPAYFLQLIQLDNHKWRMHADAKLSSERRSCQDCGEGFASVSNLSRHRIAVHNAEAKIACSEQGCEKLFETILDLENHKKHTHSGGCHIVQCSVCGKKCVGAFNLRRHEATHNQDCGVLTCDQCGKSFKNKNRLKLHLLWHGGPQSWLFTCEVCGKKCINNTRLRLHSRSHSKVKPYVCEICGAAYPYRHTWRTHMKNKHGKTHFPKVPYRWLKNLESQP